MTGRQGGREGGLFEQREAQAQCLSGLSCLLFVPAYLETRLYMMAH